MEAVEQTNTQLAAFEEIIRTIREKTQVINDIVFKTQLLSFNASIEAARAGQYGRGFAVVAEEVGKLALMSGSASKEIDHLLNSSMSRVGTMVEDVRLRVHDGKEVSSEALKRFAEIARQIAAISDKITQVGEATLEQEGGVEQTARAMDQMDQAALHNKKSADEMFKVAERVRSLGSRIRQMTADMQSYVREDLDFVETPSFDYTAPPVTEAPTRLESNDHELLDLVKSLAAKKGTVQPKTQISDDLSADDPSFRKSGSD
jgi:methyl-accepting chemotaxis protein